MAGLVSTGDHAQVNGSNLMIKKASNLILAFFVAQILCLITPQMFFCQASTSKKPSSMADLVGDWGFGHSLMLTYLDHGIGNYSHSGNIFGTRNLITFKFDHGPAEKYKFVALETKANGGSILTFIQIVEASQHLKCGHSNGYFECAGRQEWTLRKPST